ncbi:MAG: hypothetical protein WBR18_14040, partial [Anaerolineales bacterium]
HTGLMTYTLPLIMGIALAGYLALICGKGTPFGFARRLIVPFVLAILAGGLSETSLVVQGELLILAAIGLATFGSRTKRSAWIAPLMASIFGTLLAGVIVWAAPGNDVRQSLLASPAPWAQVVRDSAYHAYLFAAQVKNHQVGWGLVALAFSFLVGWRAGSAEELLGVGGRWGQRWMPLAGLPILVLGLIASVMAPSAYALGSYPDGRVLVIAHFVLAAGVVTWGLLAGLEARYFAKNRSVASVPGLGSVGTLMAAGVAGVLVIGFWGSTRTLAVDARQFAASWDARAHQLSLAPADQTVEAASLTHMGGLAELDRDPNDWVNQCLSNAYGLHAVVAK